MNGSEQLADIARIFDRSASAAAVVNGCGEVLYRNSSCIRLFDEVRSDSGLPDLSAIHSGLSYERSVMWGIRRFRLCVTPLGGDSSLVNIIPENENYISMLSAAVRKAAGNAAEYMESLSECCTDSGIAALNGIDGALLTLLSEALIPEELELLGSTAASDYEIICISETVRRFVRELDSAVMTLPMQLFVSDIDGNIESGLYSRISSNALRLLMMDFISECMDGEYRIEGAGIRLARDGFENYAVLELSCGFIGHTENIPENRALSVPTGMRPVRELERALAKKFGCEISHRADSVMSVLRVRIPLCELNEANAVRYPLRFYGQASEFSDIRAYLARHGMNSRYKKKG